MHSFRSNIRAGLLLCLSIVASPAALCADIIVSAQDGKFVRVDGRATFPEPAPSDSLVVIDASTFPPVIKGTVEGLEHTVQGPPQAVAVTPDGKLAIVAAPTRYDYAAKKEVFDNFVQVIDIEASPPKLIGKVDVAGHTNGLSINREGTLLLAAGHDGTVKVLGIDGKNVKLLDQVKVGEKRLSGISFTHDGKAAIVAQRDENGAAVLSIDGMSVKLTSEKISTGVTPYAVDVSSDGKWAVIGNTGVTGMLGLAGRTVGDADVVTLVDVSKRPFRAVQQISVPSTPEGVAISADGRWIAVSCMAGSNLTTDNVGRNKIGKLLLFEIKDGWATKVSEVAGAEAAQGVVFSQDGKQILLQMDVERAIGVFAVRDGKLVDTGERLKLAAGPVSIRSMPR
ncbi:MAG: YncE family protein [Betaproteobacteria bacterium]|nr:MAG: YncE family protein [Betaproteobacteria bacterium]